MSRVQRIVEGTAIRWEESRHANESSIRTPMKRLEGAMRKILSGSLMIALGVGIPGRVTQARQAQSVQARSRIDAKDEKIREAVEVGIRNYSTGDSDAAKTELTELVRREPDNIVALETLGLIRADQAQFTGALPLLEHAYAISPGSMVVLSNLGAVYLKLQRFNDAARIFGRAIRLDPRSGKLEASYGEALMGLDRYAAASDAFSTAVTLEPKEGDYRYNWALALYSAKQFSKAGYVLEALEGKETSAPSQALLADVEEQQGHITEAIQHYHAAASLVPSVENIHALGLELLRHGKFTAAKKIYEYGRSLYPSEMKMEVGWALAEYGNNDFGESATDFAHLLQRDPQNAMFESLLEQSCEFVMGGVIPACKRLISLAAQHPDREPLIISAVSYLLNYPDDRDVDLKTANQLVQLANQSGARSAEFQFLTGVVDQEETNWDRSIAPLEAAIKLNPHLAKAHYRLAQAYFRVGKRKEGAQEIVAFQNETRLENGKALGIGADLLAPLQDQSR